MIFHSIVSNEKLKLNHEGALGDFIYIFFSDNGYEEQKEDLKLNNEHLDLFLFNEELVMFLLSGKKFREDVLCIVEK